MTGYFSFATTDILFVAKNRLEFTKASLSALVANTDWKFVDTLYLYDDGSTDGTRQWLSKQRHSGLLNNRRTQLVYSDLGAPAAIMKDYIARRPRAQMFAKIDNDVIVPPWWLNACIEVFAEFPGIDLLGIEPPKSRTPRIAGGTQSLCPELNPDLSTPYALCDSIGGIGLMKRYVFDKYADTLRPHSIYGGFTEWQLSQRDVTKAWIAPPLDVFLLDRMPTEPWASLSREYIAKGWQRPWSNYDINDPFWSWWYTPGHML